MKKIIITEPLDDKTIVYMTPEQVALFILFQQHYDNIGFLMQHNVFDMKQGNVHLSFDNDGLIKSIKKETFEYRFPKP